MMKFCTKLLLLFSFVLITKKAQAQLAGPSLFSEVKSINPALISNRKQGQYTLIANTGTFEKNQDIDQSQEADLNSSISGLSFFRGGKGSGFITTELSIISQTGTREIKFRGSDPIDFNSDITSSYAQLSFSLGSYLGIGITKQSFLLDQNFYMDFSGSIFDSDEKIDRDSLGIKVGALVPLGIMRLGIYYEIASVDQEVSSERPSLPESSISRQNKIIGIGLGFVTNNFHLEFGVEQFLNPEKGLLEEDSSPDPDPRNRLSLTIETKLWGLAVGYTGRMYQDGYQDPEDTVINQLIYENSVEDRVEHIINFSLGGSSGLSFGGSFSFSETEGDEINPMEPISLGNTYKTKTKQVGLMAKLGYVW